MTEIQKYNQAVKARESGKRLAVTLVNTGSVRFYASRKSLDIDDTLNGETFTVTPISQYIQSFEEELN